MPPKKKLSQVVEPAETRRSSRQRKSQTAAPSTPAQDDGGRDQGEPGQKPRTSSLARRSIVRPPNTTSRSPLSLADSDFQDVKSSAEDGSAGPEEEIIREKSDDAFEEMAGKLEHIMNNDFPDMMRQSEQIFQLISGLNDTQPSFMTKLNLERLHDAFEVGRRALNRVEGPLVWPDGQPLKVTDYNEVEIPPEVDFQVYLLNLTSLLLEIRNGPDNIELSDWERLDENFPSAYSPAEPAKFTFTIALWIRCHRLMASINATQSSKPLILAAHIFCDKKATTNAAASRCLRDGPHRGFADIEVDEDGVDEVVKSFMSNLLSILESGRKEEIVANLYARYPIETSLGHLKDWATEAYEEIQKTLLRKIRKQQQKSSAPQTEEIEPEIAEDAPEVEADDMDEDDSSSDSDAESQPRVDLAVSGNNEPILSGLQLPGAVHDGPTPSRTGRLSSSNRHAGTQESHDSPSLESRRRPANPEVIRRNAASQRAPSPTLGAEPTPPRSNIPHRRTRDEQEEGDDEEDEDSGYEKNDNAVDSALRRQLEASRSREAPAKKARPPPSPMQRPPSRSAPQSTGPIQGGEATGIKYNRLSQDTRHGSKTPQTRTKWSAEDDETLCLLMILKDCIWSQIATVGNDETGYFQEYEDGPKHKCFTVPRNQQAVRDRARNLKVYFLQTDRVLPANFDMVALGKKERENVMRTGRNPDRKEDDLDDDRQPINTMLDEE